MGRVMERIARWIAIDAASLGDAGVGWRARRAGVAPQESRPGSKSRAERSEASRGSAPSRGRVPHGGSVSPRRDPAAFRLCTVVGEGLYATIAAAILWGVAAFLWVRVLPAPAEDGADTV